MSTKRLVSYLHTLRAKESRLLNSHSHPYYIAQQSWGTTNAEVQLELAETATTMTAHIADVKDILTKRENIKVHA